MKNYQLHLSLAYKVEVRNWKDFQNTTKPPVLTSEFSRLLRFLISALLELSYSA